jgi:squalene-hopene/tetraprenyl-beta-curcumene cyclase
MQLPASHNSPALSPLVDASNGGVRMVHEWMLAAQNEPGYWLGELEGDTILESEYAMMIFFMQHQVTEKMHQLAAHLRKMQSADGGWAQYPGGVADVSGSVKAYFALKLVGDSPDAEHMVRARNAILELGGATAVNSFTKFTLAMLGQYDWDAVPAIPPEIILLPPKAYFNIYAVSSWSRAMIITMALIWHHKPVVEVPQAARIDELFQGGRDPKRMHMPFNSKLVSWRNFFLAADRAMKVMEKQGVRPLRAESLKRCEAWMVEHFERSGGVGAIFPPMVNSVLAMRCLGYADDHPYQKKAIAEVEALEILEDGVMRVQPCFSPVWDTALSLVCLRGSGMAADHPAMQNAARWLMDREVRNPGDIHRYRPQVPVTGWYFEFANEFYPDVDDTVMVLMALDGVRLPPGEDALREDAVRRAEQWLLAMQSQNGGWAAFDVDNDREVLTMVPFADHNAMLDPPTSDITARVLEGLARLGHSVKDAHVQKAIAFLKADQEKDGCWYGRWGVNYIYGTWQVLRGMEAIGCNMREPWLQHAATWLRAHQNSDGGWGESCDSYEDPSLRGQGPSTASQTAWALMGLMSAGDYESLSVREGVRYLLESQKPDGSWDETWFTGTGFPRVFYLRYHLYRIYFPMYALGMYYQHFRGQMNRPVAGELAG